MKHSVSIIGAGPGGLTAAMLLAARGFEVDVFERAPVVGGRNAAIQLGPYKFDTGPTFLMMKYILDEVFLEAGAKTADELKIIDLDPMYRLQFVDKTLYTSPDLAKTRAEIARKFPGHESALDSFMASEAKRFARMMPCLQKDYSSLKSMLSGDLMRVIPHLSMGKSVFDVLDGYFKDPDLAIAFSFQAKYLGMSPWECPGFFAMLSHIEYAYGVQHVQGGLSEISEAMARVAKARGARIHLNAEVKEVVLEGRRAVGVKLADGTVHRSDDVVIIADFGHALSTLFPAGVLRKYSPEKLRKKRYSCSTYMMYLGLDKQYDLPHHTIFFSRDYKKYVTELFKGKKLSSDISFYIRNASATDPTLAPAGHSTFYVLVPVPNTHGGPDWQQEGPGFRRLVLDGIKERTGFADLEQHISAELVITPEDWEQRRGLYAGATFNLAHNIGQMLYLRPHNRFEEIDNCYLAGGGTHPGSGLPTIYESGRISANLICKARGIKYESHNPL